MPSRDLIFRFLGEDAGAGRQFDRMAEKSTIAHNAIGKLALGTVAAGATVAVVATKMAGDFQKSMELIHTQAGASQREVERMSKAVLGLAGPTATAPEELAKGLYHLESSGLRGAKALEALRIAAEGAKIGGADLESVTNALNAVIASGIKGAHDMSGAMGMLNATVGSGDMRMQDLAEAMGTGFLAVVKGFGVTLRDSGAALAVFGDNNIRGADAATQLRMSVLFLAQGTQRADGVLRKIGLSSKILQADLASGGLNKALGDLHGHLVKAGDTGSKMGNVLLEAFGHKAGVGLSVLEGQFGRFQTKYEEVAKGGKKFGEDWTAYNKTFAASFDRAKSSGQALMIQLGTVLLPVATKLFNYINQHGIPALKSFGKWLSDNKSTLEPIAKDVGILAASLWAVHKAATAINAVKGVFGLLGGAGKSVGGIGNLGKTPVPVFVTNMGGGGLGGVGGAARGAGNTATGAAEGGIATRAAAKLGLTGISRLANPLALTYFATSGGDQNSAQGSLVSSEHGIAGQRSQVNASANALASLLGAQKNLAISADGALKVLDTAKAVQTILSGNDARQIASLRELAKQYPNVAKAVKTFDQQIGVLNQYLVINTGLAKINARAHRQAVAAVIAGLRGIPGALAQARAEAKAGSISIGDAIAAGITVGINQGNGKVELASRQLVDGALKAAARTAQLGSPSRVTTQQGKWIAEGLANGIIAGTKKAEQAAKGLVRSVTSQLNALRSTARQLASSVAGTITGNASLLNTPNQTVGGIESFLGHQVKIDKAFTAGLAKMAAKHFDPRLIADLAQAGPEQAGNLVRQLANAATADVRRINREERDVYAAANKAGQMASRGVYGKDLDRLGHKLDVLNRNVTQIGRDVVQAEAHATAVRHQHTTRQGHHR